MNASKLSLLFLVAVCATPLLADNMSNMQPTAATFASPAAKAVGVVKEIDNANDKITIAHEAIASIQWPAMTMRFKITKATLGRTKVGDKIAFEFVTQGRDSTVTSIVAAK
ncbi:MAG: copper-binding protein [Pseudomonadota bacterium]